MSGEQETKNEPKTRARKNAAVETLEAQSCELVEVRGTYGVFDESGQVLTMESSEIKAYRAAEPHRARVQLWPHGATREQVVEALNARIPAVKS